MPSLADAAARLPLVLGTNPFGWTSDEAESFEVLDAYFAGGGAHLDTADGYSYWAPGNVGGESEVIVGRWIRSRGVRDQMIVATKVARHPEFKGLSSVNVAVAARASLARMQLDAIDVYYAHYDDPDTPIAETVAAFDQLVTDGVVHEVALSNYTPERVTAWLDAAAAGGHRPPVALQPHYNLVQRSVESDLLPTARAGGLAIVPYFGLASGFLTGKYRTAEEARSSHRAQFLEPYLFDQAFAVVDTVVDVARSLGVSAPTVALAWLRAQPGVLAPIASASSPEQMSGLLEGAAFQLPPKDLARLSEVSTPR